MSGQAARRVDVVVLGAGAAGMMAALEASRRSRRVLLVDHNERPGRKILISGGGRCNFTNIHTRAESFLSENPHFARSALARYTPAEFIALVERHGIAYHEKKLGQLFCDGSAQQIVTMLERECGAAGVELRCGVRVSEVRLRAAKDEADCARFSLQTDIGAIRCDAVIVATGGLSIPKMGATGFGYELARQFGHAVVEPRAALVPLVFAAEDCERWCDLAGVSAEVTARAAVTAAKKKTAVPEFREKLLVTHRGLSGPAVLQASSYWRPGGAVQFDLAPEREVFSALREKNVRRDAAAAKSLLREALPARMAERWVDVAMSDGAGWTNAGLDRLERRLHEWRITPEGTEGFAKAEVTAGGVDTRELDARTMESWRVPGLYFIGEVVDVTGWLGGYNFQWAWASAVSAGRVA
ncbi:MAG TPA: NAD(P)/FAD-dependent oxidoreductase [Acidobacteriaceae bacterium]|nr:NAD(P)/FAD-dependent oxidoreductase [Acidobacteriaceae bacterium]